MKKIFTTGLIAGVAMIIINLVLNPVFNALFPFLKEAYMNPEIFRPWGEPLMMLFFVYPIILGFAFAFVWDKTKHLFGAGVWRNGLYFALIYFFVSPLPALFINYSSFKLPFVMVLTWTIMSLINGLVAGVVLAKLNKA